MGLDITAYSHLELAGKMCDAEDDFCSENHVNAFSYASFPKSYAGLAGADEEFTMGRSSFIGGYCYKPTDKTEMRDFCAGSYGGYSVYRNELSDLAFGMKNDLTSFGDNSYWNRLTALGEGPFWEQINFADNEGSIGPVAAEKLYHDYVNNRDKFLAHVDNDERFVYLYDEWTQAYDLARHDGLVRFH